MVEMTVRDNDVGDLLIRCQRVQDGAQVIGIVRTRVNHSDIAVPQEIRVGPCIRHRRGVVTAQHPQIGRELDDRGGHGSCFPSSGGRASLSHMFGWLKNYMPRSLYGRAALILLLPVVTVQLAVSVVFIQRHYDGVTEQMTRAVILELAYLRDQVDASEDAIAAQEVMAALAEPLQIDAAIEKFAALGVDGRSFYDLSGRAVIRTMRSDLDGLAWVDMRERKRVYVVIQTTQGLMSVEFDRRRVSASNPHQLLVLMVVLGVLMTCVSYVFLRNQLRPIKRMAGAAAEYGKGRIVDYRPSGANEVRAAGNAFLDMRNRIERQTQQRTMMLSGVSHDLRTPLTRLRLGLSLMDEAEAEPLVRDVEDMQRMLDGFLDFARGDADVAREEVDPAELLRACVEGAKRARMNVTLGAVQEGAIVRLGPIAVRRAVDNLIGNAVRYGSRAVVSMSLGERALVISVDDDGPGIPDDQREEARRAFTRLDPSRNQDLGGGVGLGLAITSDIARGHGGLLRLDHSDALGGLRADLVLAR